MTEDTTARTLQSFGYEWTTFDRVEPEDERFWRTYVADLDLGQLAGRRGLDVGCGKGRYTRFVAPHLESMVALDGSEAVEAARRNLADLAGVWVVRADLRHPPLRPGTFGFVQSLGVLHHLDDPEAGFRVVVDLLAPGGILLVYLYSRPAGLGVRAVGLRAATALRRLTTRLPHPALRALSAPVGAALYGAVVVPGRVGQRLGVRRLAALPLATYRDKPVRSLWLDTFDRLSAPVEHRYLWSDLQPWFDRAGLAVEAVRDESGFFVVARRPTAAGTG